ncbi:MAG: conjugal transfer protein TraN [Pseudomonadota bacterium]
MPLIREIACQARSGRMSRLFLYCCFNSKLARIVHEQGRPQLQGDISSWGGAESPNCRGFTPEEFQMLDFARIDLSEWYGDIEVKAQDQIESDMEESVESFYDKISP